MSLSQSMVMVILAATFGLIAWGRWRHDVIAFGALIVSVVVGVVPSETAFMGFGHPATVTVAAVLILSRALTNSGAAEAIARNILPKDQNLHGHLGAICGGGGLFSAFMNNVGALALILPVALQAAAKLKRSPALLLMPLAFASILGGLITLIGTPPNVIVATYRGEVLGSTFQMFDFTPVGLPVAMVGIAFVAFLGWRLIPTREGGRATAADLIEIEDYVTEARVVRDSRAWGMTVERVDEAAKRHDVVVVRLISAGHRMSHPAPDRVMKSNDKILVEGGPTAIDGFVGDLGLKIVGAKADKKDRKRLTNAELMEAVVNARSRLEGRTVEQMRFAARHGMNLLAVSRQGRPYRGRLLTFRFKAGDVLLFHGQSEQMAEAVTALGCLPLRHRGFVFGKRGYAVPTVAIFAAAILVSTLGLLDFPIALGAAVVVVVVVGVVTLRELYESVDWAVIVLLASLIPVGKALDETGATAVIAHGILESFAGASPTTLLVLLMVVATVLSAVLNNAATALVMAPIGVGMAAELGLSADPFLMAVAISSSCAFLTPIGHQNNTLVMGPGGYRFGDYWRLGLPVTALAIATSIPLILWFWPLHS